MRDVPTPSCAVSRAPKPVMAGLDPAIPARSLLTGIASFARPHVAAAVTRPPQRRTANPFGPRYNAGGMQLGSVVLALGAQLRPVLQPLGDLALEAAVARTVELLSGHALGKVVLA